MDPQSFNARQDNDILERIRNGEMETLRELYFLGRNTVRAFVTRNSGSADEADDVLQDALVILWQRVRANRFELRAQPGTFLYATARNLWLRRLAQRKRERPVNPEDLERTDDALPALEAMVRSEDAEAVRTALTKLSDQCRSLLLAFYWEELSMEEIAVRFGFANAQTAKSKKYQCKRSLRELLTKGGLRND
jgi:RNA polymerase sigma factor (sigma-70 family)